MIDSGVPVIYFDGPVARYGPSLGGVAKPTICKLDLHGFSRVSEEIVRFCDRSLNTADVGTKYLDVRVRASFLAMLPVKQWTFELGFVSVILACAPAVLAEEPMA